MVSTNFLDKLGTYVFLVSKYDSKTPDPFSVEILIFLCCELSHLLEVGVQIVLFMYYEVNSKLFAQCDFPLGSMGK